MLKKILVLLAMLYAAACFAAVDVNKASATELDAVKGIGPVMSKRIIDERKKGDFKNWADLVSRVKGIGDATAAKLSAEGLTVKGEEFKKAAAKNEDKKEAKAEKKEEKKEAKADKKDEKKESKAEKKEEKAMAKDAKKEDKTASSAKPAASAKK